MNKLDRSRVRHSRYDRISPKILKQIQLAKDLEFKECRSTGYYPLGCLSLRWLDFRGEWLAISSCPGAEPDAGIIDFPTRGADPMREEATF